MKYAIWTAVSSEAQAAGDKVSLSEQEAKCRGSALDKKWREAAGPYVVPGESRTKWINLRDAENAIPALHEMLDSAQRGDFDILVVYDYSRLRELLDPVSRTLAAYGVQVYSISQPVEPQAPEGFDAYATDTSNAIQLVSGLTSRAEINALRRRYRLGIPRRVIDKGLHTVGMLPYGYRKPPGRELDHDVTPILEPDKAIVLKELKNRFLAGQSIPQLTVWMNTTGLRPARSSKWGVGSVRKILINPYYAGLVQHGAMRIRRDPRTGKSKVMLITDRSKIVENRGRHEPLWDAASYHAIRAELTHRHRRFKGHHTHRLSRLLYCGLCDQPLHVTYYSSHHFDDEHRAWYCKTVPDTWHMHIRDNLALDALADQLTYDLAHKKGLNLPQAEDRCGLLRTALADLEARRERLIDALEIGDLDSGAYSQRVRGIEKRISDTRRELDSADRSVQQKGQHRRVMEELAEMIETLPSWIRNGPAQEVNMLLRQGIERIKVYDGGTVEILYS